MISSMTVRASYDLSSRWPTGRRLVKRTAHHLRSGRGSVRGDANQMK